MLTLSLLICLLLFANGCKKTEEMKHQNGTPFRISTETDPETLDPRLSRDLSTVTVMHMLYEGLMRSQENGEVTEALAQSIVISPDKKTYTFHLRPSAWSNADPVTAYDFENTWKSLLDPQFPSPNAYQLYVIKGAQAAKEGSAPKSQIGVHATDDTTLVVELEHPIPYFLKMTATHFFYPVHKSLSQQSPANKPLAECDIITNGPFHLEKWDHHNALTALPNSHYWDRKNVHLDRIQLIVLDNPTALQLFLQGELDWTGSPLSTLSVDALSSLKKKGTLDVSPGAGVYFMRLNTGSFPFNHVKMRRAFALALNRAELVEHVLQGNQEPALGLIPYPFMELQHHFKDHDIALARRLFQEVMEEHSVTLQTLPPISIQYGTDERSHKIAQVAQQQWKMALGINVQLKNNEKKVYYDQLKQGDYQIGIGSWFADFDDPISFLDVFKFKDNGINHTEWENPTYIALLDASAKSDDQEKRHPLLQQAETLIINEMPIIPLFYSSYNYMKHPAIKGVNISQLGYLDFKYAYWDHQK
ncbi:MAG: peptide ABC transporter substrate-binding protein [Parachlamydiaceae bacterium]